MGQIQAPAPKFWPRQNPLQRAVWHFCSSNKKKIDSIYFDLLSPSKYVFYQYQVHSFSLNRYRSWYSDRNLIRQHIHNRIPFIQGQPKSGKHHHGHQKFPETRPLPLSSHQKDCRNSWECSLTRWSQLSTRCQPAILKQNGCFLSTTTPINSVNATLYLKYTFNNENGCFSPFNRSNQERELELA